MDLERLAERRIREILRLSDSDRVIARMALPRTDESPVLVTVERGRRREHYYAYPLFDSTGRVVDYVFIRMTPELMFELIETLFAHVDSTGCDVDRLILHLQEIEAARRKRG